MPDQDDYQEFRVYPARISNFLGWIFGALIAVSATVPGTAETVSPDVATPKERITGQWNGYGNDDIGKFRFHTVNCENGNFAVAVVRRDAETFIYFGKWETDGLTMTHNGQVRGMFDAKTLEMLSLETDEFSNLYHITNLTDTNMEYEYRGEDVLQFKAKKQKAGTRAIRERLPILACDRPPSLT